MTCAAQAAELLAARVAPGDVVLDVGCGSGYFYHSLRSRALPVEYYGIDAAPSLVAIGREHLPAYGLPQDRLRVLRIEDLAGEVDHVVCLNVLSNIDNYHRPLERLLETARKSLILRESLRETASYEYVTDAHLDHGAALKVHVNTYPRADVLRFIESHGFHASPVVDRRADGGVEMVIGYPHYWAFVVADRRQ